MRKRNRALWMTLCLFASSLALPIQALAETAPYDFSRSVTHDIAKDSSWKNNYRNLASQKIKEMSQKVVNKITSHRPKLDYLTSGEAIEIHLNLDEFTESHKEWLLFPGQSSGVDNKYGDSTFSIKLLQITSLDDSLAIQVSQNNRTATVTIKRVKNKHSTGKIEIRPELSMTYKIRSYGLGGLENERGSMTNESSNGAFIALPDLDKKAAGNIKEVLEDAPPLQVEPTSVLFTVTYQEALPSDPQELLDTYIRINSSAGNVTLTYAEGAPPVFETLGERIIPILVTDEYQQQVTVTLKFQVQDNLLVSLSPEKITGVLGEKVTTEAIHNSLVEVKRASDGYILKPNEYDVTFDSAARYQSIGSQTLPVTVTAKDPVLSAKVEVPVDVKPGTSILVSNDAQHVLFGLAILNGSQGKILQSVKGSPEQTGVVGNTVDISVIPSLPANHLLNEAIGSHPTQLLPTDVVGTLPSYNELPIKNGDIIHIHHDGNQDKQSLVYGYNSGQPLDLAASRAQDWYFLVGEEGLRFLKVNQLTPKTDIEVSLYTGLFDIGDQVTDYFTHSLDAQTLVLPSEDMMFETVGRIEQPISVLEKLPEGKDVRYQYNVPITVRDGELTWEIPKQVAFEDYQLGQTKTLIERKEKDKRVTVCDTRQNKTTWALTLKEKAPSALSSFLLYKQADKEIHLNQEAHDILSQTHLKNGKVVTEDIWSENTGLFLTMPTNTILSPGQYQTELEWTLTKGEP